MMKHKKKIGVMLVLIMFAIMLYLVNVIALEVYAVTSKSSVDPTKKCDDPVALTDYFGFSGEDIIDVMDINKKTITLKANYGEFKIVNVEGAETVSNAFTKNGNYYFVDGREAVFGKNPITNKSSTITLNLKAAGELKLQLVLASDINGCKSWENAMSLKGQGKAYKTYEMSEDDYLEFTIPDIFTAEVQTEENNNYNGASCKKIRADLENTQDPNEKAQKSAKYNKIIGYCWEKQVTYNYKEEELRSIVDSAIQLWKLEKKSNSKIGYESTADATLFGRSDWHLQFDAIAKLAKESGNAFYAEQNGKKTTFYELINGNSKGKEVSNTFSLKCNAVGTADFSNVFEKDANGNYNIDANKAHYYAMNYSEGKVRFRQRKANGELYYTNEETICKKTCEETVEVKYGPPVASKAGLCFEYQIQVTSRVRCNAWTNTDVVPPKQKVCTPVPICVTASGKTIRGKAHQGGGNEEFESCIYECDGGKYTKSCSNKCYKKIYSNSNNQKTSFEFIMDDTNSATKLARKFPGCAGKYVMNNGKISWKGNGKTYARYYCEKEYSRTVNDHGEGARGKYVPDSQGYKRYVNKGDGHLCAMDCKYKGCSENDVLNPANVNEDYEYNVKLYKTEIAKCQASASCTNKTATFKISVKYTEVGTKKEQTVEFPYDTKEDKLKSSEKDECSNIKKTDIEKGSHTVLDYAGCYQKCGDGLEYHTRWSFPGTWINNKTGEISYKEITDNTWTKYDKKFCIPLNADNVNTAWWNYYWSNYNRIKGKNTSEDPDDVMISKECPQLSGGNAKVDKWNIVGETTQFGYFGWNIKVSCFYALNSNGDAEIEEKCGTTNSETDYRIRSVNLENLFPNKAGEKISDANNTGRTPGFNWTTKANMIKNEEYLSYPKAYRTEVQSTGYKVYNGDEYLDYEFNLTKEQLKKLKEEMKSNKTYDSYTGEMILNNGVYTYKSKLFRGGILTSGNNKIPKEKLLGCNNLENYERCK